MKAYAIVIEGNETSERGFRILSASSDSVGNKFEINCHKAVTPDNVEQVMHDSEVKWNYPWEGEVIDFETGLVKRAYKTSDPKKRMACSMSHFELWQLCYQNNEPILILEHDAMFVKPIDFNVTETNFRILGINNPIFATRKASTYHNIISRSYEKFIPVPYVDDDIKVPQGLAGNSAYIVTPMGAAALMTLVYRLGMWPNDAIMCKQLVSKMGVTRNYYTRIQGLPSTTTL